MAKKQEKKKEQPEMVQITFRPQFSAAESKTVFLRELESELVGNTVKKSYKPMIAGLPQVFTIRKDEIVTISKNQFIALYKLGFIDTPEDLERKRNEFYSVGTQSGIDPQEHRSAESLAHLYEDNFIRIA